MARHSPTAAGFRTVFHTPSLWLAEMAWRWSFGISAGLILLLAGFEFVRAQTLSSANLLFLHSGNPLLRTAALMSLLQSAAPRLLRYAAVLIPTLALLWSVTSALGRAATLSVLRDERHIRVRALLGLSFLRAALAVAALSALAGAIMLPGSTAVRGIGLLAIFVALATAAIWSLLSWVLALAAIPAAEGQDALSSVGTALTLVRSRIGAFSAAGTWFGLLHLVAAVAAYMTAVFVAPVFAVSTGLGLVVLTGIVLAYFALADFLKTARLVAYTVIAEDLTPPSDPVPVLNQLTPVA